MLHNRLDMLQIMLQPPRLVPLIPSTIIRPPRDIWRILILVLLVEVEVLGAVLMHVNHVGRLTVLLRAAFGRVGQRGKGDVERLAEIKVVTAEESGLIVVVLLQVRQRSNETERRSDGPS